MHISECTVRVSYIANDSILYGCVRGEDVCMGGRGVQKRIEGNDGDPLFAVGNYNLMTLTSRIIYNKLYSSKNVSLGEDKK